MTSIYRPSGANDFECINAVNTDDYEAFFQLNGVRLGKRWKPILVRRVRANERQLANVSDFPWLGGWALILRRSAVDALRDMLNANGELLPLSTDDGLELFVFNAQVIDALDEENSSIVRFPDTGRIMHIKKVAFHRRAIEGHDLFRLPHRASATYLSERFVDKVRTAGLRGLDFKKVWSG